LNHLHHQLALSICHPYGALGKTGSDGLSGEVGTPLTFVRFKISKPSDRLAGHIGAYVLRCTVRIADQSCYAADVENAIKITTGGLGSVGELIAESFDLCAGVVGLPSRVLQLRRPPRGARRNALLERRSG
jgi:hypothetical protein